MMDHLSTILPKVLQKRGLQKHAQASLVVHRAQAWLHAALPALTSHVSVASLRDGVLTIACANSVALQECSSLTPALREYLQRECKDAALERITVIRSKS